MHLPLALFAVFAVDMQLTPQRAVLPESNTECVSVNAFGRPGNRYSTTASISADGGLVAFASTASDLVGDDTNGLADVFVRDLAGGATQLVSIGSNGERPNRESTLGALSPNGRLVVFGSAADNLVVGDTNGVRDVFVRDLERATTVLVSRSSTQGPVNLDAYPGGASADGRFVAFTSRASNVVPGDLNDREDVFLRDLVAGTTERVSVAIGDGDSNGVSQSPVLSDDGRYVAFASWASNLVAGDSNGAGDVFLRDRQAGVTTLLSRNVAGQQGNAGSFDPFLSPDGSAIAFASVASNLVADDDNGDIDVFLKDLSTGVVTLESRTPDGRPARGASQRPSFSADRRWFAFASAADDLVADDRNFCPDIFVRDRFRGEVRGVSVNHEGRVGNDASFGPLISRNGTWFVFDSFATDLVSGDGNHFQDVFRRRRLP